jgi:hypothetical protein
VKPALAVAASLFPPEPAALRSCRSVLLIFKPAGSEFPQRKYTPPGPQRKDENALGAHASVRGEQSRQSIPYPAVNLIGSPLTGAEYAALESRWIDRGLAARAQLHRVNSLTGAVVIGRKNGDYAGLVIPYFHPESNRVREYPYAATIRTSNTISPAI